MYRFQPETVNTECASSTHPAAGSEQLWDGSVEEETAPSSSWLEDCCQGRLPDPWLGGGGRFVEGEIKLFALSD